MKEANRLYRLKSCDMDVTVQAQDVLAAVTEALAAMEISSRKFKLGKTLEVYVIDGQPQILDTAETLAKIGKLPEKRHATDKERT